MGAAGEPEEGAKRKGPEKIGEPKPKPDPPLYTDIKDPAEERKGPEKVGEQKPKTEPLCTNVKDPAEERKGVIGDEEEPKPKPKPKPEAAIVDGTERKVIEDSSIDY